MGVQIANVWHFDLPLYLMRHLSQLYVNCTKSMQFAPKFACLISKIEKKISEEGRGCTPPHPLTRWEGVSLSTALPLGAFGASIITPSALELGVPIVLF